MMKAERMVLILSVGTHAERVAAMAQSDEQRYSTIFLRSSRMRFPNLAQLATSLSFKACITYLLSIGQPPSLEGEGLDGNSIIAHRVFDVPHRIAHPPPPSHPRRPKTHDFSRMTRSDPASPRVTLPPTLESFESFSRMHE